ncbi:MAG TPA: tRNA (adenosine(37)-N6)-threonylcarbamoyltransferase complex transferase subunit TsaD [Planctomycetota bacterium]|jgi:N6-L-threonylcarbamoyladenine synthase|nr:tRNA (adenosine(37)-N6)-threonylcarbamoyltransferase complex transferase subunit TsaD [Planctomycetota bacterium]HQB00350.1 tRNA (adenosine(37)-N6)-threonylcarbamoyltransferase complex transferase subunit TsaD [Planctomycetota bacterium]
MNNTHLPKILAIDTSCDDTSVAILEGDKVLSSIVSSQNDIHREWGGVVPSLAKRAHQEYIQPCIQIALKRAKIKNIKQLQAIAVTYGPGLAPSLEVGIAQAKQLSLENNLPLIPVNHMEGHLLSPLLKNSKGNYYSKIITTTLPWLVLVVSGGHTEIVWCKKIGTYEVLGRTLDDAAGEAFDKVARMLDLGYPGGVVISHLSKQGNPEQYKLPRPMSTSNNYDFSFSGLKTACLYQTNDLKQQLGDQFADIIPDYCASLQEAIVDSLLIKFKRVLKKRKPKTALVGGGVSANLRLRKKFRQTLKKYNIPIYFPYQKFCMDNAAMIGLAAFHKYKRNEIYTTAEDINKVDRIPNLTY